MHIQSIPMCMYNNPGAVVNLKWPLMRHTGEGTGNNYAYLVTDEKSKEAVIIDPANPPECVLSRCIRWTVPDD